MERWRQLRPDSTSLDLSGDKVGEEGLKHLVLVLPQCLQLRELYLGNNNIGEEGFKHLTQVLSQCLQLRVLYSWSTIGDEGFKHLAQVLPQCPQLQKLTLGGHNMGDEGLKLVASVLPQCPQLQDLNLWGNGEEGIKHLASVLSRCLQLRNISLGGNNIGKEVEEEVRAMVNAAMRRVCAARPVLALLSAELSNEGVPSRAFVRCDGDHAVMRRVLRFLV